MGKTDDQFNKKSMADEWHDIKDLEAALKIDAEAKRERQEIEERYKRDYDELLAAKIKKVTDERSPKLELNGPEGPGGSSQWPTMSIEQEAQLRLQLEQKGKIKAVEAERDCQLDGLREPERVPEIKPTQDCQREGSKQKEPQERQGRQDMRALFKTDATPEQQRKKDEFARDLKERSKRTRDDKDNDHEM